MSEILEYWQKIPIDNAEHMTDVSPQEGNTNINNKMPADSASLQTEAIAKSLVPKNIARCEWKTSWLLWQTSYRKKVFCLPQSMMNLMKKNPGAQLELFQGRGGFVKLGHFDKHFIKKSTKKSPAGKNFGVFSLRYS